VFILPRFTREDEFDRSRGAPLRPSYGKKRIVRRERRMDSIRTPQFPIRTGTKRAAKTERRWWCLRLRLRQAKKEKYRRRNADRRKASSAVPYGHGRASIVRRTSIGVSRPKESFIARDSASGHASWDATNRFGPFRRAVLPAPICPQSSNCTLRPSRSARGRDAQSRPGAGCKSARGRRPRRRDPACLPGRVRLSEVWGVCKYFGDKCQ
jgi:hypothetical protein